MADKIRLPIVFGLLASISGCQAPPPPDVRPFGDAQFWMTTQPVVYSIGSTADRIVIPRGFVTDFASIPKPLWTLGLTPYGQYSRAALIHDYLYWAQGCSRAQSDRLLLIAMKESKVGGFDEFAVYNGVHLGGTHSWQGNAKERASGLPRVIPRKYLRPDDPNMGWPAYRAFLVKEGVLDPVFEKNAAYCRYGDSTDVP
ncbi:MAG TPA: DUF1353 domain-containing protein [Pseudomonas sp.]|jgi:hypothetical protein